jgi:AcrR family transcriptional regulator
MMRKDAFENHQKILQTATQLFKTKSIAEVSMTMIASQAGIGVGTLYRNYQDKSELCMALVYRHLQDFVTQYQRYLSVTQESPHKQFTTVLEGYLVFRNENTKLLNDVDHSAQQGLIFYQSKLYDQVRTLLMRVLAPLKPMTETEQLNFECEMLISMLKSDSYQFERDVRKRSSKTIVIRLMRLLGISNQKEERKDDMDK